MTRRKNNRGVWWAPYAWGAVFVGVTAWGIDRTGSFWSGVAIGVLIILLIMALLLLGVLLFTADGRKVVADAERCNREHEQTKRVARRAKHRALSKAATRGLGFGIGLGAARSIFGNNGSGL